MVNSDSTEISLSKGKLIAMLGISLLFIGVGLWFVFAPPAFKNSLYIQPLIYRGVGIISVLFWGLFTFILVTKLQDTRPGLIVDSTGITDNTSGISAGYIPWADITEIKQLRILNQRLLSVMVKNPEDYIARQPNEVKRKVLALNYKSCGSPVGISSSGLTCNFKELENLLQAKLAKYGGI